MSMIYDLIIIGAGMAGLTSAIYAARKRMGFLVISEDFGGQINIAGKIENFPGFKQTDYIKFREAMEEQVEYNKIKIQYEKVARVEKIKDNFKVATNKDNYKAKTVIIASGARARKLNIPGEDKFANRGVSYCAFCDGPVFKDNVVAVICGGDSSLEAADFLMKIAKKIYMINITEKVSGHEYLMEKVIGKKKVETINNAKTIEIFGNKFVRGLKYEQKRKIKELKVDGIFVQIGRVPNTEIVKDSVELDEHRHIKIDIHGATNVEGLFAAGDCSSIHEYQFAIAAGQGCAALLQVVKYLQRRKK